MTGRVAWTTARTFGSFVRFARSRRLRLLGRPRHREWTFAGSLLWVRPSLSLSLSDLSKNKLPIRGSDGESNRRGRGESRKREKKMKDRNAVWIGSGGEWTLKKRRDRRRKIEKKKKGQKDGSKKQPETQGSGQGPWELPGREMSIGRERKIGKDGGQRRTRRWKEKWHDEMTDPQAGNIWNCNVKPRFHVVNYIVGTCSVRCTCTLSARRSLFRQPWKWK